MPQLRTQRILQRYWSQANCQLSSEHQCGVMVLAIHPYSVLVTIGADCAAAHQRTTTKELAMGIVVVVAVGSKIHTSTRSTVVNNQFKQSEASRLDCLVFCEAIA
jgi:hypothetical protein